MTKTNVHNTRCWVVLLLLTLMVQMAVASVHVQNLIDVETYGTSQVTSTGCHGSDGQTNDQLIDDQNGLTASCCDGNCSMNDCHTSSAAFVHFIVFQSSNLQSIQNSFDAILPPLKRVFSLYRPPIFA